MRLRSAGETLTVGELRHMLDGLPDRATVRVGLRTELDTGRPVDLVDTTPDDVVLEVTW